MSTISSFFVKTIDSSDLFLSCLVLVLFSVTMGCFSWHRLSPHLKIGKKSNEKGSYERKSYAKGGTRSVPSPRNQHDRLLETAALKRKQEFLQRAGDAYGYRHSPAGFIDGWRRREIPSLVGPVEQQGDPAGTNKNMECEVYLDYAGSALPWKSQQEAAMTHEILANPHSTGPAAERTARRIEQVKKRLLDWLDAQPGRFSGIRQNDMITTTRNDKSDPDYHCGYEILFTSGATEAMQIVTERMGWQGKCTCCQYSSHFVYPVESHTSLVGMRGPASAKGAELHCLSTDQLIADLDTDEIPPWGYANAEPCPHCPSQVPNLLALPLECNFGGRRINFSGSWTEKLSRQGRPWFSLLDIAKAVSTGPVKLRELNPDFACLSFYKVFGSPTGLGCLLVKRKILKEWLGGQSSESHYQGGGSVDLLLPRQNITFPRSSPSLLASLNLGTCHFRGIVELDCGFDVVDKLGGMVAIHKHATALARECVDRLWQLRHANGNPLIRLYGIWGKSAECQLDSTGPTIAFNLQRQDGTFVGYNEVAKLAALNRPNPIQLRVGCLCNPGACQEALGIDESRVLENHSKTGHVCGDDIDIIDDYPTGVIRVSFGKESTWEDLDILVTFLDRVFVGTGSKLETSWDYSPRQVVVEEQYIFPIKSCAAQRVPSWKMDLSTSRLVFDREFALVDASGTAMRLQRFPRMAFIEPTISLESNKMTVRARDMPPLEISLTQNDKLLYGEGVVSVCGNKCSGVLWGDAAVSKWFSDFLGVQCWLARFAQGSYTLPQNLPSRKGGRSVAFANEQPLLLISKNAVDLLNDVLESQNERQVTSRHFRPNFVVQLPAKDDHKLGHAEDGWKEVRLQDQNVSFDVVGQCARCSMVDVDPRSGSKGHTLRALADYRRNNGQINFGIFLKASTVSCSDKHVVVREGNAFDCK